MPRAVAAVAVAVSGGRDSTALLHATARAARALGVEVHALHVHHGLVDEADAWLQHLQAQCRRWARAGWPVQFHAHRLTESPGCGDSVEAWARQQRYRALAAMARAAGCGLVLLAHHRRDQAETLLMQALRGGGPAGLAAMPKQAEREGIVWARPWLDRPREAIEAYLRRHRLSHVEDPSNASPHFARNRLRADVWPALTAAFPDAEPQLVAAARRAAEASACLAEMAATDLRSSVVEGALQIASWAALSTARRSQLLRAWLGGGPESLVQRLAAELPGAQIGRWPAPGGELRLHGGALRLVPATTGHVPAPVMLDLGRPGHHALPDWGGALRVERVERGGIVATRLHHAALRPRKGGEQFQLAPRSTPRSLKKQYQARRVPAWERGGPLVFDGDVLLFVPGLGTDARCLAAPGELQMKLTWVPAAAG
jgi:tRNA(Ile)-lysidine synthase